MCRLSAGAYLRDMRKATIGCLLALVIALGLLRVLPGAGTAPAATSSCGTSCRAAYRVIARALPQDHTAQLARAIAATPGFDYRRLARVLRIPTAVQLRAQWRRRCDGLYPDDRAAANRCFALILPSTYRYLVAIPA
jgi:hypothetical protein